MNTCKNYITLVCTILFVVSGCIEPYQPPPILEDVDILVVDGYLNSTDGSATVRLTHANTLSNQNKPEPEQNAAVAIRTEDGSSYPLIEQDSGTYILTGLNIDPAAQYQLSVRTSDEEEYLSDYVPIKQSPAIDSITWEAEDDGVNILVNAHDATGSTRYYRWDYVETWQYHAAISSDFILIDKQPVYRADSDRIYTCWRTVPSTKISIASSIRLAEDVIRDYPITFLSKGSSKVSVKYSILVKQRAISKAEFDFWGQLKKTTEDVGGLFDPLPSQVPGNIHNLSNPSAPVLGYFSAGAAYEARFFLSYYDLPDHLRKPSRETGCTPDTIMLADLQNLLGSEIIGTAVYSGPFVIGYTRSSPRCADCRVQGGTVKKPAFWP